MTKPERLALIMAIYVAVASLAVAQSSKAPQDNQSARPADLSKSFFSIVIAPTTNATGIKGALISVTVTNISDQDLIFPSMPLEHPFNRFHLEVRDSQGKEVGFRKPRGQVSNTPKIEDLPVGSEKGVFMRPGTSETFDLDLQKTFLLDNPGKYTVQAKLLLESEKSWLKSNTLTITVVP
ncbi:MAG TPA: hypothetical protein VMU53_07900 [Candidatus Sulfotelmatobacter sp.]|nr:hypothetical protein [Candidatus Sulfotelmatobacter sp.]